MVRKDPPAYLLGVPCSITAVSCALKGGVPNDLPSLKSDGWATLKEANRFIRANLAVEKRTDYRRGERLRLKDLHLDGKAIVCVYGHLLYLEGETYWSFFENEEDEVVAVWKLKNESNEWIEFRAVTTSSETEAREDGL